MGEGVILDPLDTASAAQRNAEIERRVGALEQRPQVVAPVAMIVEPYNANPSTDWWGQFTNAAYGANGWSAVVPRIPRPGIWWRFDWRTGAGTTGEVQLTAQSGTLAASAIVLPAASSGSILYRWLHNGSMWNVAFNIDLGVRRTGGANVVEVRLPIAYFVDASACTLTGI